MEDDILKLHGDKKLSFKEMVNRSRPYLVGEIKWIILALLIICINVVCDAALPLIVQRVVDSLKQDPNILIQKGVVPFIAFAVAYLLISLVNLVFIYVEGMILQKSGQRIVYKVRMEVFEHITSMSLDQFNEMPVGSLVTRVANYTAAMSNLFTQTLVKLIKNTLTVICVYVVMLVISWQLALIILAFMVLVLIGTLIFTKISGKLFRKERSQLSDFNSYLNESLSGMKITQLFNQEKKRKDRFVLKNNDLWKTRFKIILTFGFFRPSVNFIGYASLTIIFIFGVMTNLSAGMIVAFYLYVDRLFTPIQEIADEIHHVQRALTACERLFNFMDVKPHAVDKPEAVEVNHFEGKIEFRNVWFAYEKEEWVLKDVSFTIDKGDTCAFVGATGAGKTTILSLLVRNYIPQKGQILIDDVDISTIKVESLRKAIGQMLQDVFLFSGTVKQNITLFDETISDESVNEAIKYVNADQFINKLDNKLDNLVVERGENFSQGQRQLLSFARTLVAKPQILVLDEATANIDTETEVLIQDSLEKMKSIGTMLIVAHRLSTIQKADKIICLQNGCVVEEGNHQSLLKNKGYYYNLYRLQFKKS